MGEKKMAFAVRTRRHPRIVSEIDQDRRFPLVAITIHPDASRSRSLLLRMRLKARV